MRRVQQSAARSAARKIISLLVFAAGITLAPSAIAGEKVFLWEAAGPKGKAYLLGSIHFARPELYPLDEAIMEAFRESQNLVVEIDLNKESQGGSQLQALVAGVYGDGRKLEEEISAETLRELKAFLSERDIPFENFNSMKPWLVALGLTTSELLRLGYQPEFGIDRHFLKLAEQQAKAVHALETADFQIQMVSGFSDELQELFLLYTLRDIAAISEKIDDATTAWKEGDVETMQALLLDGSDADERMKPVYEKILYERNRQMTAKIADLMGSGGTWFVVVGAFHMIGEGGIVDLLGNNGHGFEVSQVSSAAAAPAQAPR